MFWSYAMHSPKTCMLLLQCTLRITLSIIGQQNTLVLEHRLQVYRASPEHVNVLECLFRVGQVKLLTLEEMLNVKFAIAAIVAVLNHQIRKAKVGHASNNTIAYLAPILLD